MASNLRKRRGVIRGSITRLEKHLVDLESSPDAFGVSDNSKQLATKLESLDTEFKYLHFDLINEGAEELDREQETLDLHDDNVSAMSLQLRRLVSESSDKTGDPSVGKRAPARKLSRLQRILRSTEGDLAAMSSNREDVPLLEQRAEQLTDYKKQLASIYEELVALDLEEEDDLFILHTELEEVHFSCAHSVRKLLSSLTSRSSAPAADGKGVKLPKLEVPTSMGIF